MPIFDHKQAELTALAGEPRRASHDRRAVLLNIGVQVREAALNYEAASESLKIFTSDLDTRVGEDLKPLASSYLAVSIAGAQLLLAQDTMVAAQLSYLDSLREYWAARSNLEFVVGADLDKVVQ